MGVNHKISFKFIFCLFVMMLLLTCVSANENISSDSTTEVIGNYSENDLNIQLALDNLKNNPDNIIYADEINDQEISDSVGALANAVVHSVGDYETLVAAIAIAQDGDEIYFISSFSFNETNSPIVIDNLRGITFNGLMAGGFYRTISGGNLEQIFYMGTNTSGITFKNLEFRDGNGTNGGAIHIQGTNHVFENVRFINNNAENGGAVFNNGVSTEFHNVNFTNNKAIYDGGAMYLNDTVFINPAYFNNNSAERGGALFISNIDQSEFTFGQFYNNSANLGGAIYTEAVGLDIAASTFINNNGNNGSAIYQQPKTPSVTSNVRIMDSNFVGLGNLVYLGLYSISYLEGNSMSNNLPAQIINHGTITSDLYLTYLNGRPISNPLTHYSGEIANLTAVLTDDVGNVIVGGNVTFNVGTIANKNVNNYHNGNFYWNYLTNEMGIFPVSGTYLNGNLVDVTPGYLRVNKVVLNTTISTDTMSANIGELINYTVTIVNNGNIPATSINITEITPAGLTYHSFSGTGWSRNANGIFIYTGTLAVNGSTTLNIIFEVNGDYDGIVNNTIIVKSNRTNDTVTSNGTQLTNVTLEITKVSNLQVIKPHGQIEFIITVTNVGSSPASNVKISDYFPSAFLDYVGYRNTTHNWIKGSGIDWYLVGNLSAGSSAELILIFNVTQDDGTFNNTASVISDQTPNSVNDTSNNVIISDAVLNVTKISSIDVGRIGDYVNFTITIESIGTTPVNSVTIQDFLPIPGLDYLGWESLIGTWQENNYVWTYTGSPLVTGQSASFVLKFRSVATGIFNNTINVKYSNIDVNYTSNDVYIHNVTLEVEKTVNRDTAQIGELIEYTINVTNTGTSPSKNIVITEDLNIPGLQYVGYRNGTFNWYNNGNIWSLASDLPAGQTASLVLIFNVTGTGTARNNVTVNSTESENKSDITNYTNLTNVILNISKTNNNVDIIRENDLITYTITIRNDGNTTATNVKFEDYIPSAYLTYISYNSINGTWNMTNNIWYLSGGLAPGATVSLNITFQVVGIGTFVNVINVTSTQTPNGENASSEATRSHNVSLNVTKKVNVTSAQIGEYVRYDIIVDNYGTSGAYNVTISDNLNIPGLIFEGYINTTGNWRKNGNIFVLDGVLANGSSATLTLIFRVTNIGNANNTVFVNSSEVGPENDTSDNTTLTNVLLDISKIPSETVIRKGEILNYTISITNYGNTTATNLNFKDYIPQGLEYLSYVGINGTWNTYDSGVNWILTGDLAPGATVSLVISFRVTTIDNFTNVINVTTDQTPKGQNESSVNVRSHNVSLMISKDVNVTSAQVGDQIAYTITVTNDGESPSYQVTITDILNSLPGLTYVGYRNTPSGNWTLFPGNRFVLQTWLPSTESASLILIFVVTGTGITYNTANASSSEVDNKTAISPNTTLTNVSLNINKIPSETLLKVGEILNYTITITNTGTTNATNLNFRDYIPSYLQYINFNSNDPWSTSDGGVNWNFNGILGPSQSTTLTLSFLVISVGNFTNTINVTTDQTPKGENKSSDYVRSHNVTLIANKTVNANSAQVGDYLYYTITVKNNGTSPAFVPLEIFENLNIPGLSNPTVVNDSSGFWVRQGAFPFWISSRELQPNETVYLVIRFLVNGTGIVNNTANVTSVENDNITVVSSNTNLTNVSLVVTKNANGTLFKAGELITYTIIVRNTGTTDATNINIREYIPQEFLDYVDFQSIVGTWDTNDFINWFLVGNLANGTYASLNLTFRIKTNGSITNVINVTTNQTPNGTIADETVRAHNVTLIINKTANRPSVNVGGYIYYTITVINNGTSDATNVYLNDYYDESILRFLDVVAPGWSGGPNGTGQLSFNYDNGILRPGESSSITIRFLVIGTGVLNGTGVVNNTAIVNSIEDSDNITTNNSNVSHVNVSGSGKGLDRPELSLVKVGSVIYYNIAVRNGGSSVATNVSIYDFYVEQGFLIFDHAEFTGGWTWTSSDNRTWHLVGDLLPNQTATLRLYFILNNTGYFNNTFRVTSDQIPDGYNVTSRDLIGHNVTLDVNKTVDKKSVQVGDYLTYTINVKNVGTSNATYVRLFDDTDNVYGLRLVGISSPGWTSIDNKTFIFSGSLAPNQTAVLVLRFLVIGIGITNNTFNGSSLEDGNFSNSSENTILTNVTFNITKVSNATFSQDEGIYVVKAGELINFTITIKNTGTTNGTNLNFTDYFPSNILQFYNVTYISGDWSSVDNLTWHLNGNLTPNEIVSLVLTFRVIGVGIFNNTINVTTDQKNGTKTSENITAHNVTILINKTVNVTSAQVGDKISYTITFKNIGTTNATNVIIFDDINITGLNFIDYSSKSIWSQSAVNHNLFTFTGGNLTPNQTVVLVLIFEVVGIGTVNNTVLLNTTQSKNNTNTSGNTTLTNVTLDISKDVANSVRILRVNDTITYIINITNTGTTVGNNVSFYDYYVEQGFLEFIRYDNGNRIWNSSDNRTWILDGDLTPNQSASLNITFRVIKIGTFTNTINVTTNQTPKGQNETSPPVRSHNVTLIINKEVNVTSAQVGDLIRYTITVNNTGTSAAVDVLITDLLTTIPGLSFVRYENTTGNWMRYINYFMLSGTLMNGTAAVLTLIFRVNGTGTVNNTAFVNSSETETINDTSPNTNLTNVSLIVSKLSDISLIRVGENITFYINITNNGTTNATNLILNEIFDSNYLQLLSYISNRNWIVTNNNGTWTLDGNLNVNDIISLNLTFRVVGIGIFNNTINVTTNQTPEGDTANVTVRSHNVTLDIIKEVNKNSAQIGDIIEYSITVSNIGNSNASNVVITDDINIPGLLFKGFKNSTGNWTTLDNRVWTLNGELLNGTNATLVLIFEVVGVGVANNTAIVNSTETNNTNATSPNTNLTNVSIILSKIASADLLRVGDTITFYINITNNGTTNATNLVLNEIFSDDYLRLISFVTDGDWSISLDNRTWTLNYNFNVTNKITLNLTFLIVGTGVFNNTINVTTDQTPEGDTANATVRSHNVTLDINKTVDRTSAQIGDEIRYYITVSNNGNSSSLGVVITDNINIPGLQFIGYENTTGANWITSNNINWNLVGELAKGDNATLILVFRAVDTGIVNNTAIVNSTETSNKNDTSENTNITNVSLLVTKIANVHLVQYGDYVTFTINITNNGTTPADNVKFFDFIPYPYLEFVSYDPIQGTWSSSDFITWSLLDSLAPNEWASLNLTFKVIGFGTFNNTINVTTNQTPEGENFTSENVRSYNVTLIIIKEVDVLSANIGDYIRYTITIINEGTSPSENIVITDNVNIPGLIFVGYENTTRTWNNSNNHTWSLNGILVNGTNASLILIFRVAGNLTGLVNNTAIVNSTESDNKNDTSPNTNLTNVTLEIIKKVNQTIAHIGDLVSYQISVKNTGSTTAHNVTLTDNAPLGMVFVSQNSTDWTYNNVSKVWTLNNPLGAGDTVYLTIIFRVVGNYTGIVNNTVTVNTTESKNNTNISDNTNLTNVILNITKTVDKIRANVGDLVTYVITVTNTGKTTAHNVTLTDNYLSSVLEYNNSIALGWIRVGTSNVWNLNGTLAPGESVNLTIIFRIIGNVIGFNNTAVVNSSESRNATVTSNNTMLTNVVLEINKTVDKLSANVGDLVTYVITIKNTGDDPATKVLLTDLIPNGMVLYDWYNMNVWLNMPGSNIWTLADSLDANSSVTLTLVFRVVGNFTGIVNNTAIVNSSESRNENATSPNTNLTNVTLVIIKSVDKLSANVGDLVTYVINITNTGSSVATNVNLVDLFPNGMDFVNYSSSLVWDHSGSNVWTLIGNLSGKSSVTLTLVFRVNGNVVGLVNNSVVVNTTESKNNTNISDNTNLTNVTLVIIKSVDKLSANVGDLVTYVINVTNTGSSDAHNVVLTDLFPDGMVLNNTDALNWSYTVGSNVWTLDYPLAAGSSVTLTLIFRVVGNVTGIVNNTVIVNTTESKNNTNISDNTNLTNVTLEISKSVDKSLANVGDLVTYVITVTNTGSTNAHNVVLTEQFPTGLTFVNFTGGWNHASGTNLWTLIGSLGVGQSVNLTLVFRVNGNHLGATNNTAVVNSTESRNETVTSNNTILTNTSVDITKVVNRNSANIHDYVEYVITVNNKGSTDLSNITLFEIFPNGMDFINYTSTGSWSHVNGSYLWTLIGVLYAGDQVTLTLLFRVNGEYVGIVNNTVIFNSTETDNKTIISNNTNLTNVTLEILKSVDRDTANIGDYVTYTIFINNIGSTEANNVIFAENFPNGMAYVNYTSSHSWNHVEGSNVWTLNGGLNPNSFVVLYLTFRVTGAVTGAVNNTVIVNSTESKNNSAISPDTNLTNVTLVISKSVDKSSANIGDLVEYVITVNNIGSSNTTNVTLLDLLPNGMDLVNYTSTGVWARVGSSNVWTLIGGLNAKSTVTLTLLFRVTGAVTGIVYNTVIVNSTESKNNSAISPDTNLTNVTLVISKSVDKSSANFNDLVEYVITVNNVGSTIATNVNLVELFPNGMDFVNYSSSLVWSHISGSNVWTLIGGLNGKSSVTLTLVFRVNGNVIGLVNNSVVVNSTESKNNSAISPNTNLTNVHLAISKIASNDFVNINEIVNYTISISNIGSNIAHNVKLTDYFPDGLEYLNYTSNSLWSYDDKGNWVLVNNLNPGETVQLVVVFRVIGNVTGNVINIVNVSSTEVPNGVINSSNITLYNLIITKKVNNPTPNVGNVITWFMTISNNGHADLFIDYIIDYCPIGMEFVSASDSYMIYDYNSTHYKIIWSDILIQFNTSTVLFVNTLVKTTQNSTNYVVIGNHTPYTTKNMAFDSAYHITNITISKLVNNTYPYQGEIIEFYVDLIDNGPNNGYYINTTDILPLGFEFLGYETTDGIVYYNPNTRELNWFVYRLSNTGSYRLILFAKITAAPYTNITNEVVTTTGLYDVGLGNPRDNVTVYVQPGNISNLKVQKIANESNVKVGTEFSYIITITNHGPDDAENVYVIDYLPEGIKYISSYATKGDYDVNTGKWTIGYLANGESVTLHILVLATVNGTFINFAYVYSDSYNPGDNSANATVIVYDVPEPIVPEPIPEICNEKPKSIEMEKTGNPILIILLILISIISISLKRKN